MRARTICFLLAALALGESFGQLLWFHVPVSDWESLTSLIDKAILILQVGLLAAALASVLSKQAKPNALPITFAGLALALGVLGGAYLTRDWVVMIQRFHPRGVNLALLAPVLVPGGVMIGLGFLAVAIALAGNDAAKRRLR